MFGFGRKNQDLPHAVAEKSPESSGAAWVNGVLTLCVVLLLIAGMIEGYRRVVDR